MLQRLTSFAIVLAFCVIVLGAYVRLSDAGLGCPDWPVCYGRIIPPTDAAQVAEANAAYPQRAVEVGKAWKEQVHRYLASLLGLVVVSMAVLSRRSSATSSHALPLILLVLVVFQGMLGMWTVTLLLKPLVVTAHLFGGLATLSLLWCYRWQLKGTGLSVEAPTVRRFLPLALLALLGQIFLGGWTSTNYAAWACGADFPWCHGRWWPETDFAAGFTLWHGLGRNYEFGILDTPARTAIHMSHRVFALAAAIALTTLAYRLWSSAVPALRWNAVLLTCALALQLSLGIANVVLGLPLWVAVAHNGGAALLLLAVVNAWCVVGLLDPRQRRGADDLSAGVSTTIILDPVRVRALSE